MRPRSDIPILSGLLPKMRAWLTADRTVALWLGLWWLCNLIQAAATELANDEAYYQMFAEHLAWGYFDHPPITALLVRLGACWAERPA